MTVRFACALAALACTHALVLPYGRAGSVRMGPSVDGTALVGANGELLDCIAEAVNGDEIEQCELKYTAAFDDATANDTRQAAVHATEGRKTKPTSTVDGEKLVGANGQLLDCIAAADNGEEIEACELVFEEAFDESTGA